MTNKISAKFLMGKFYSGKDKGGWGGGGGGSGWMRNFQMLTHLVIKGEFIKFIFYTETLSPKTRLNPQVKNVYRT